MNTKQERIELVNQLLEEISKHGRKFFAHKDRIARLEMDTRGRIWFVDDYTNRRIYTHYSGHWRHFSHGGTMKALIEVLVKFVQKGEPNLTLFDLGYRPAMGSITFYGWGYSLDDLIPIWRVGKPLLNATGMKQLDALLDPGYGG